MHSHEQALQRFLYDGNFDKSAREINGRNASGAKQTSFFFFKEKKKRQSKSKRATFYLNFDYPVLCVTFEEPSSNLARTWTGFHIEREKIILFQWSNKSVLPLDLDFKLLTNI